MLFTISDFDYTAFEHGKPDVFTRNKAAIRNWRAAGNLFAIATGRGQESLKIVFPDYADYCDYTIFCDGAMIEADNNIVSIGTLGEQIAEQLRQRFKKENYRDDFGIIGFEPTRESPVITAESCKVRFWFSNLVDCAKAEEILASEFRHKLDFIAYHDVGFNDDTRLSWITPNMRFIIEVVRSGINKTSGIMEITNHFLPGISRDQIITIGDDRNDLDMILAYGGYTLFHANADVQRCVPAHRTVPHLYSLIESKLPL